jgi:hypothetical protein
MKNAVMRASGSYIGGAMRQLARRQILSWSLTLILPLAAGVTAALADDDPCAGFKWDVSAERALFNSSAVSMSAGLPGSSRVTPNQLYAIKLMPATQVVFPVPPGRTSPAEGTYAGVFALSIPSSGRYRIAIDGPYWIDVVADGKLVPPSDYEGLHGCPAPRKIVEFLLERAQQLVLQLSGATQATLRLTITPVPKG